MKILILTDSVSLPRAYAGGVIPYEKSYPYLVKKEYNHAEVLTVGIGGATMVEIVAQAGYYHVFEPDLVFIQCGIVDCAPRAFKKYETRIIKKLRLFSFFKPFVRTIRKYRNYRYTKKQHFINLCGQLNRKFGEKTKIYSIGILPVLDGYEQLVPGMTKSVKAYNEILKSNFEFIDFSDFPANGLLEDFHHLNEIGHAFIFNKLKPIINAAGH